MYDFIFKTLNPVITEITEFTDYYWRAIKRMVREIDEFKARGLGWTLATVENLEVRINTYTPLRASSYVCMHQCKEQ